MTFWTAPFQSIPLKEKTLQFEQKHAKILHSAIKQNNLFLFRQAQILKIMTRYAHDIPMYVR